jgi:hypothetical protein
MALEAGQGGIVPQVQRLPLGAWSSVTKGVCFSWNIEYISDQFLIPLDEKQKVEIINIIPEIKVLLSQLCF